MKESFFTQPTPPLDQLTVHDGDLTGRATERDESEFDPESKRLSEGDLALGGLKVCFAQPICSVRSCDD
jgi:hypothetical protein